LNSGNIRGPAHDASERIDLSHNRTLGNSADGRIAGHLTNCFEILSQQKGLGAAARGQGSGFGSCVTATDDDDVEAAGHSRATTRRVTVDGDCG
jgi:hypothetical protein